MTLYDSNFYEEISKGALASARKVVPKILQVFGQPKSVVDFGCGTGAWLSVFREHGATDLLGLDGSDAGHQLIDDSDFMLSDLSEHISLSKKYDLAISLEVAEHLDERHTDMFVRNICNSSDSILWSAAVPGQRGVNHVNEQWPIYWVPKFEKQGFHCNGEFRYEIWFDEEVENWYRQNILLFSKTKFKNYPPVKDLIHYNNYPNYGEIEERYKYDGHN